jgi:hypothetical protein
LGNVGSVGSTTVGGTTDGRRGKVTALALVDEETAIIAIAADKVTVYLFI